MAPGKPRRPGGGRAAVAVAGDGEGHVVAMAVLRDEPNVLVVYLLGAL